jgi:hypothetical protein
MTKRNKLTYEQITAIRELYTMGVNAYQIAKKLGIASSVARYHIKSMLSPKIPITHKTVITTNDKDNEIIALLKQTNKALLEIININFSTR